MKIKDKTEITIEGVTVESLIEELSKFVGKGAIIGDVGSYGCSSINIVVEREETPTEKALKAEELKRNEELALRDMDILQESHKRYYRSLYGALAAIGSI